MNNTTEIIYEVHPSKNPLRKIFTKKRLLCENKGWKQDLQNKEKGAQRDRKALVKDKGEIK